MKQNRKSLYQESTNHNHSLNTSLEHYPTQPYNQDFDSGKWQKNETLTFGSDSSKLRAFNFAARIDKNQSTMSCKKRGYGLNCKKWHLMIFWLKNKE